jgi:hypothetical protein
MLVAVALPISACSATEPRAELAAGPGLVTTTLGSTTTTSAPPTVAQDRAAAQRVVLRAGDVPSLSPSTPTGYASVYVECTHNQLLPTGNDPRQATPSGFLRDETAEVRRVQTTGVASWAVLAPSDDKAREVPELLRRPAMRTCFERGIAAALNDLVGETVVLGTSTRDLNTPALGDDRLAFRTRIIQRGNINFDFELTAIRRGRAIAYVLTGRLGAVEFEEAERHRLVGLVASRMPAA